MMHYSSFLHVYYFDFNIIAFLNINNFDCNEVFILIEKCVPISISKHPIDQQLRLISSMKIIITII